MQRRWRRPFTILDAMILIAASAVGLALARAIIHDAPRLWPSPTWVVQPVTYFLLTWTTAFIPLRLRSPRPPLGRLMLQPGMAACCAATILVCIQLIAWATIEVPNWERNALSTVIRFWRIDSNHPGPAVAMTLILVAALALGSGVYWMDPEILESRLGLPPTEIRQFMREVAQARAARGGVVQSGDARSLPAPLTRRRWALVNLLDHFLPLMTLGAAAATFRHRRRRSRRAMRHVGTLTTAVVGMFVGVSLINEYVDRRFPALWIGYGHNLLEHLWWFLGEDTSLGVVALWCVLAIGRHWRTSPDWTDRLGRAIGIAWVLRAILGVLLKYAFVL